VVAAITRDSGGDLNPFREPAWNAPVDVDRELECIPPTAMIRGMFIMPVAQEAKRIRAATTSLRDRYVPFQFYPLREHARLLVDTCTAAFPKLPLRQSLRKLGRGAPTAFLASRLGRVVMQPEQGLMEAVNGLAKGYELSLNPGRATVTETAGRSVDVTLEDIHYFIDSHHVGAFEGAMKFAGVQGRVRVHRISAAQAVLRLTW
jgi:uncharacterized protein (TIGR02265 family)